MEQHLAHFGTIVLKFWLHIDPDEQLRRFQERQKASTSSGRSPTRTGATARRSTQYRAAVEEMLYRTSTPFAPWTVVESNCKWYARVKVLETVCEAIREKLKEGAK